MNAPDLAPRTRPAPRIDPCVEVIRPPRPAVGLLPVTDEILERLVIVATMDTHADEVTPRVDGAEGWTATRVAWLRDFHRDRRGSDGPESTWAVEADGVVVGAVRLAMTRTEAVHEVGIWLSRSARRRGIAHAAMARLEAMGRERGGRRLQARTTPANTAALRLLRSRRFELVVGDGRVEASLDLV